MGEGRGRGGGFRKKRIQMLWKRKLAMGLVVEGIGGLECLLAFGRYEMTVKHPENFG